MDDIRKRLGHRIWQARKKKGLTQLELCEQAQISPSHLSDIEQGKKNLGIDIFIRLANSLDVSADWLLELDTPQRSATFDREFEDLLSDCSVSEKRIILKMARDMKEGLRAPKN